MKADNKESNVAAHRYPITAGYGTHGGREGEAGMLIIKGETAG